jgi:CRP/FNR family transcriptional regulator, polysaccharide utilization system transcription regulator
MKKILVIEDNFDVRENLCELLELTGYEVISAENGRLGVQEAINDMPDLIVCDIMMPVLDGYGTLKIVRSNPKLIHIPFIFLTAKSEKSDFRSGMNQGADDYIVKPFTDFELLDAIEIRLNKAKNTIPKVVMNSFIDNQIHFDNALSDFLENKESKFFNRNDFVYKKDSLSNHVYWIKKGTTHTYMDNDFGKQLIFSVRKENEFIGINDVFCNIPYQKSAVALEYSEIIQISKNDFLDWLKADNSVSNYFNRLISLDIVKQNNRLIEMAYSSVRKRLAETLIFLCNKSNMNSDGNFVIKYRREDIANISGASKETIIRTLSEFKDCGVIQSKGSKITILDYDELQATPH